MRQSLTAITAGIMAVIILQPVTLQAAQAATEPWPTKAPNAPQQEPAFPAQTRAPQMHSEVALERSLVADGLAYPWAITFLPDGDMLVTERLGDLRVVTPEGQISEPIKGMPKVDSRDQGGLLDVLLAPDFAESRMIYFAYSEPRAGDKNATAVARGRLSQDRRELKDMEVIFRQQPAWDSTKHFGSRLVWNNKNQLFITLGERSLPKPRQLAQDLNTHIGKVVRVNPDGSVPKDNPFTGDKKGLAEIYSYGHRNIQGATLHPQTGALWTIEHGPRGGDEINIPQPGENYGWPVITYGEDYSGKPIGQGITKKQGMEQPIYYWDPVIAPSGMLFYEGDMFAQWRGDLLIASLSPGALVRLRTDGKRIVGEERLLTDVGRVRDLAVGPEGAIYLITDEADGRLLRLSVKRNEGS